MKYACIDQHRDTLSIARGCRLLAVSESGYYAWRTQQSAKPLTEAEEARWVEKSVSCIT